MNLNETSVAQHYNHSGFEYESIQLQERSPVEFAMTARYLDRWIPEGSTVVDIGVGVGHYAELLAQRGCSLYLVDIAQKLLDATCARLNGSDKIKQQLRHKSVGSDSWDGI